jgi:hypothetical protein
MKNLIKLYKHISTNNKCKLEGIFRVNIALSIPFFYHNWNTYFQKPHNIKMNASILQRFYNYFAISVKHLLYNGDITLYYKYI